MQLKTGKMQGGCRWELIPHDEDGLTVREIPLAIPMRGRQSCHKAGLQKTMENPINEATKPVGVTLKTKTLRPITSRKQIESLPLEEQHKRNNVEAAMFQYSFHTRKGKPNMWACQTSYACI